MIQHVTIEAREEDVPALVRFWGLLGFEEVEPPGELVGRATWVQRERTQVHLLRTSEPVAPPDGHVAVVAADYDATLEALRQAGFAPQAQPQYWGEPRSFVRGPGGHLVEVMAAPPPM